jgi:hypothetical protein
MPSPYGPTLVVAANFLEASRDAGYKNVASALGELIDNAFEADASSVRITISRRDPTEGSKYLVFISDNGCGMTPDTCRNSLRFGWSSRFNQRCSYGRYGMGLPNASLSQARRVDVMSSTNGRSAVSAYLDADELRKSGRETIPAARRFPISQYREYHPFTRGTTVSWSKCDRLDNRKLAPLVSRLRIELGRIFRYQLWSGKRIAINGEYLRPIDPLFERPGAGLIGAISYGPELTFEISLPNISDKAHRSSIVRVRFTELPVVEWCWLSNEKKNTAGITKRAGVSIVRAGREIDYGWFFMGQKRRENYDDWWRCEVRFEPVLDELFGVTHTKQTVQPSEKLLTTLTPDVERIARELNIRARRSFAMVKAQAYKRKSEKLAERYDNLIEPPTAPSKSHHKNTQTRSNDHRRIGGLEYRLTAKEIDDVCFFAPELDGACLTVALNRRHPFVHRACAGLLDSHRIAEALSDKHLELLILAAARTEVTLCTNKQVRKWTRQFRELWSNVLAAYLS